MNILTNINPSMLDVKLDEFGKRIENPSLSVSINPNDKRVEVKYTSIDTMNNSRFMVIHTITFNYTDAAVKFAGNDNRFSGTFGATSYTENRDGSITIFTSNFAATFYNITNLNKTVKMEQLPGRSDYCVIC